MSLIGSIEDFPDNSANGVEIEQRALLVVRRAGAVYVYQNLCPHTRETLDPTGGSVASDDGLLLRCQRHGAEFITETGDCVAGPCQGERLEPVAFTLSGTDIYLD
ncbi:MAG: nitrite reductase/ring-hydroxylating ferredoxin subunit [Bacteroidia bacterium]|jgi:nitrite reductase/ring-hydroxylating ferredoxin subunit